MPESEVEDEDLIKIRKDSINSITTDEEGETSIVPEFKTPSRLILRHKEFLNYIFSFKLQGFLIKSFLVQITTNQMLSLINLELHLRPKN